ncbi:MAG TPA: class I SAM-dependent methyltransferase [Candidatus Acidoferrales bacterium]|nr:class I SAM-dependent methyltransferase [Candidatus Acidoferrales bacterium]
MRDSQDAYGHQVYDRLRGVDVVEIVERDDGFFNVNPSSGPRYYLSSYKNWSTHEKKALRYVRGRVLDVGCCAGRIAIYLQGRGFDVLGIDNSPLAIRVCKLRGLKNARVMSITKLSAKIGVFDTVLMFGANFGLFGNPKRAKWLLRRFHKMTTDDARILAESVDPYKTNDPVHLQYHKLNRAKRKLPGQLRLRIRYRKHVTPWFEYLFVSKKEMQDILKGTGWKLVKTIRSQGAVYIAIIGKR